MNNTNIIFLSFKALRKAYRMSTTIFYNPLARLFFYLNAVTVGKDLQVRGLIYVDVTRRGTVHIGNSLALNSGESFNVIGRQQKCIFWVEGTLNIGNNVGMSSTAIICNYAISIGNNVIIGGNTVIYDTDFHSVDPEIRRLKEFDKVSAKKAAVNIKDNVFIGAHSTILKGVTIGENSVIGAGSVVTKNIPANQVWAGNPARFIKNIK